MARKKLADLIKEGCVLEDVFGDHHLILKIPGPDGRSSQDRLGVYDTRKDKLVLGIGYERWTHDDYSRKEEVYRFYRPDNRVDFFGTVTGKVILPRNYDDVDHLGDGFYRIVQDGKCSLYNAADKKTVIPSIYDNIYKLEDNLFIVCKDEKNGIIDITSGETILPIKYDEIEETGESMLCRIKKSEEFSLFNLKTKKVSSFV